MYKLIYIILIILFLLQGTNQFNLLVLALYIVLLGCVFVLNKQRVKLPVYYVLAIIVYLFYLFIGVVNGHNKPFVDIKFQLFGFIFFFCILNVKLNFLKLLFFINGLVFIIYIMLFFSAMPNIWSEETFGFGGRLYGPAIIAINLLLLHYLVQNKQFDKKLIIATLMGLVCIALTTNFMNLAVFIALVFLLAVNFKKLLQPVYVISIIVVVIAGFWYLNSPFVPELVQAKMQYIYNPLDYPSLKTRVEDFNQIVAKENFGFFKQIFGEGFGTSSKIYRYNPIAVSLSRTFSFQEIDNGFYYIYHRGGWSLFMIFILSHIYLMFKIVGIKARLAFLAFVTITCLLSIHYFNYYFYLLIPYLILNKNDDVTKLEAQ